MSVDIDEMADHAQWILDTYEDSHEDVPASMIGAARDVLALVDEVRRLRGDAIGEMTLDEMYAKRAKLRYK